MLASAMSKLLEGNGNGSGANGLPGQTKKKAPQPSTTVPSTKAGESGVAFNTHDGLEMRGTLIQVTRHHVVFELYNPGITPRLSEAIDEFTVNLQARTVYSGRAVINSVVEAGAKTVCEAVLEEARWAGFNGDLLMNGGNQLIEEFDRFVRDWQKSYTVLPEFKEAITDIETFLTDLRIWLEQVELGIRALPEPTRAQLEQAVMEKLSPKKIALINGLVERFEIIAARLSEEMRPAHRSYIQRHLHPIVLCAPFAFRAYQKPLGYAGDYEMVNMMVRHPEEGASLFAKVFNVWLVQQSSAAAHRNRLTYLTRTIETEAFRVTHEGKRARVFNFACGPAIEVQQFLSDSPLGEQVEITLADFDNETLAYTKKAINEIKRQFGWQTSIQFERKSVSQLTKQALKQAAAGGNGKYEYDFIYCAGLFDYLTDSACKQMINIFYQWLAPGGLMVVTNVTPLAPNQGSLELILDWHLIYRNVPQFEQLCLGIIPEEDVRVKSDSTGVNIFLEARKSNDG